VDTDHRHQPWNLTTLLITRNEKGPANRPPPEVGLQQAEPGIGMVPARPSLREPCGEQGAPLATAHT
jgi:hypothetical protein